MFSRCDFNVARYPNKIVPERTRPGGKKYWLLNFKMFKNLNLENFNVESIGICWCFQGVISMLLDLLTKINK